MSKENSESHFVVIPGHNAPEWHISNIASVLAGGLACGLYTTSSPEALAYKVTHSRAEILVIEDKEQLDKVAEARVSGETVKAVVQWEGEPGEGAMTWEDLLEIGRAESDDILTKRLESQAVNMACMLVYTSGTTGDIYIYLILKRYFLNQAFCLR